MDLTFFPPSSQWSELMAHFECIVCLEQFVSEEDNTNKDGKDKTPQVLGCGHTLCGSCLGVLICKASAKQHNHQQQQEPQQKKLRHDRDKAKVIQEIDKSREFDKINTSNLEISSISRN